jgi:hypothetical protein
VLPEEKKENFMQIFKICNDYSSYECEVHMKHGLRKPLQYKKTVSASTTFQ